MTIENSSILTLDSFDELFSLLKELMDGTKEIVMPDAFIFEGELEHIHINVKGSHYHSSIPGIFARGLWEFQESVYRAVANAIYQTSDLRKLTKDDYENYNLIFKVSEGSTDLEAQSSSFFTELGKGLSNMRTDTAKVITVLGAVAILAGGYFYRDVAVSKHEAESNSALANSTAQVDLARLDAEIKREEERTKQIALLSRQDPTVKSFSDNAKDGTKALIKSAPDAEEVTVGQAHFDSEAIMEINARAIREPSRTNTLIEDFIITGSKIPPDNDIARFEITNGSIKFTAILDMSVDGPFTQEQLSYFYGSGYPSKPIRLTVDVKNINSEIKQAYITEIHLPDALD